MGSGSRSPKTALSAIFGAVLLLLLLLMVADSSEAGCSESGGLSCCQGKNVTCRAIGPRLNDVNSTDCFCDSACIEIGDCCLDYAITCPAFDCVLSEKWSEWSECSAKCGTGIKERTRQVITAPKNGGQPCEQSSQKVSCEGDKCKVPRTAGGGVAELKERGRIIPAQFATWRRDKKYDPYKDIRKNLFEHYVGQDKDDDRPSYCATYELTDVHGSCNKSSSIKWSKRLVKGSALCVECQTFSMKKELGGRCYGHGVYQKTTQWKALSVPGCHGKWTMTSHHRQGCSCNPKDDLSFVFV